MAGNVAITGLPAGTTVASTNLFPAVQPGPTGTTVKLTAAQLATYVLTNPTFTGTISLQTIVTPASNTNLTITPNGTGQVQLVSGTTQVGSGSATAIVTTNGAYDLQLRTNAATSNQGIITIANGANGNITIAPDGTGQINASKSVAVTGSVTATSSITSSGASSGVGYATGAGGTVTQLTSKSTSVALNKPCGQIIMNNAALSATASVSFTFTNSLISATDCVHVNIGSGATAASYFVMVDAVAAGSCTITLRNYTSGSLSESVVLNFAIIKAVTA